MPLHETDTDTQTAAMFGDLSHIRGQTMNRIHTRNFGGKLASSTAGAGREERAAGDDIPEQLIDRKGYF